MTQTLVISHPPSSLGIAAIAVAVPPAVVAATPAMRLPFRKRDKKKSDDASSYSDEASLRGIVDPLLTQPSWASARFLAQFPPAVLQRIFAFVCPHTRDESYETCEGERQRHRVYAV